MKKRGIFEAELAWGKCRITFWDCPKWQPRSTLVSFFFVEREGTTVDIVAGVALSVAKCGALENVAHA